MGNPQSPLKSVSREHFIEQFILLSRSLLKHHLPESATEPEHMENACKILSTKFNDALGVVHALR